MKNAVIIMMLPLGIFAQSKSVRQSTYIAPYVGVVFQGATHTEQTGTAHKRGNYNAFQTDFDLQVAVEGESKSATGSVYGLTFGSVWTKSNRKLNPGFEFDVFHTSGKHESELANHETEIVSNIKGPNTALVLAFVEEHYGAHHHTFANSMNSNSWNAAGNFTLAYALNAKLSLHSALGLGFSAVSLKDAESLQTGPADANPGYETTTDNGGGAVNHFNSHPDASDLLLFGQLRLGAKIQISPKVALNIDARRTQRQAGEFNFGSTKYLDHAPTDNWNYTIGKAASHMITVSLVKAL